MHLKKDIVKLAKFYMEVVKSIIREQTYYFQNILPHAAGT